jgi:HPt (histidine-containing phosphotransfer) domain-containing protein
MTTTNPAFLAFLAQQRAEYRALLPEKLLQIESLWRQVLKEEGQGQALATLERCAHSLAGSGATFGFAALGDAARLLELTINPLLDSPHALSPQASATLSQAVQALQCCFASVI